MATITFTGILIVFISQYSQVMKPIFSVVDIEPYLVLWTFRQFDILALTLVIFVSIIGVTALFRSEVSTQRIEEEAIIEGEIPEEPEEE